MVGKFGLERQYNDLLMGVDGQRRVVVDSMGRERQTLEDKEAISGNNLQLTLDLDLQAVAELSLEGKRGAVVALDPRNGEVLAMVSRPSFDPNAFTGRIREEDWKATDQRSQQSAAEPGDPGAVRAGIDVQADRGSGGARNRYDRPEFRGALRRRRDLLRPLLPL